MRYYLCALFTGCRNGIVGIVNINRGTGATTVVVVPAMVWEKGKKEKKETFVKFIFLIKIFYRWFIEKNEARFHKW